MNELIQRILPTVQKPARYTGGEYNEIIKDLADIRVRVAFCFPDTYEIGMSNVGMRILYGVMNQMDGVWCERVFAPWADMEDAIRKHNLPLWALESQDPVKDFDMIAFTIGYEMSYTNILNILNLAGIQIRSKDRNGLHNIVFAGVKYGDQNKGEQQTRKSGDAVVKAHEHFVNPAAVIPGQAADQQTCQQPDGDGTQRNQKCRACTLNDAGEDIAPKIVRTEQMPKPRSRHLFGGVHGIGIVGRPESADQDQ